MKCCTAQQAINSTPRHALMAGQSCVMSHSTVSSYLALDHAGPTSLSHMWQLTASIHCVSKNGPTWQSLHLDPPPVLAFDLRWTWPHP